MVTCREVVELVTDLMEDALDPVTQAEVVAHLAECPDCLRYLEQMRETVRLLGDLPRWAQESFPTHE